MILHLDRETLLDPLQKVIGVIENNQTLPILSNVLINANEQQLSVKGTDLEVELIASHPLIGQSEQNHHLTLPAKKLSDICKALPSHASIELYREKEQIILRSGESSFSLSTLPADDFPSIEGKKELVTFTIAQQDLRAIIQRTQFAMAQNDVRYYLNGLLLEVTSNHIKTVATDGHRLALNCVDATIELDNRLQVIVPRKAAVELSRLLADSEETIEVTLGGNYIKVIHPTFSFTSKLIEGRFPDYDRVIPKANTKEIVVDRGLLKEALTRTAILCNQKNKSVKFEIRDQIIRMLANNHEHELAEETIKIIYSGEPLDICFNISYLIENINIFSSDTVILRLSDAGNSLILEEPDNAFSSVFVVMPMRL